MTLGEALVYIAERLGHSEDCLVTRYDASETACDCRFTDFENFVHKFEEKNHDV